MKAIGGFFELELTKGPADFHHGALALSTGRACIRLMLKTIKPSRVYVPFYTCDATYEPFHLCNVEMVPYAIDEYFFPGELPELLPGEYFFYTNYFGLCDEHIQTLLEKYGAQLLIDNTHAFFQKAYPGTWSFTSARKYFGVPDGAYLYSPVALEIPRDRFTEISVAHHVNRFIGNQDLAYRQYVEYEKTLSSAILGISVYSEYVLSNLDYDEVIRRRRENFLFLAGSLKGMNQLPLPEMNSAVPFCYPFLPASPVDRSCFFRERIFPASYWGDLLGRGVAGYGLEKKLSGEMLPLAIDHRYTPADLERVVTLIKELYGR